MQRQSLALQLLGFMHGKTGMPKLPQRLRATKTMMLWDKIQCQQDVCHMHMASYFLRTVVMFSLVYLGLGKQIK